MKLKNMKCSEREMEEKSEPTEKEKPHYPYGLRLNLEAESLKKLEMKTLPQVGEKIMIIATAEVCSVSQNESEYGDSKSVGLQITEMAIGKEDKTPAEDKLYKG